MTTHSSKRLKTESLPDLTQFTSIGRPLDPRYKTNAAIMGITPLAGVVAGVLSLINGGDLGAAVAAGFWMGAAVFMAWVLAREVDPDNALSAFVGVALAFIGMLIVPATALTLLPLVMLITAARIVNRIVGPPARVTDSLALVVIAGAAAFTGSPAAALVAAFALLLDGILAQPQRWQIAFAVALAAVGGFMTVQNPPGGAALITAPHLAAMGVSLAAYTFALVNTRHLTSACDVPNYRLDLQRVRATMLLLPAMGILAVVWGGGAAVAALMPIWTAMLGVGLYRVGMTIQPRVMPTRRT